MAYPYTANQELTAAELNTDFAARPTLTEVATLTNKTISGGILTGTTTLPGSGQISSLGRISIGGTAAASVDVQLDGSQAAWTTSGIRFRGRANTYTDTSSSGTVAAVAVDNFGAATIAASSVTTFTDAATFYINNGPIAGTNVTITNRLAMWVAAGRARFDSGVLLNGVTYANRPSTAQNGTMIYVTDSNTATWGATIAGGGANKVLGMYFGTNWTVVGTGT